jgi:DnaJ-class molecular chaperone
MSKPVAETSFLTQFTGTKKTVNELYDETVDLYYKQFEAYKKLLDLRESALEGSGEAYYSVRGKSLVKIVSDYAVRIANVQRKLLAAYANDIKEYTTRVQEEHMGEFADSGKPKRNTIPWDLARRKKGKKTVPIKNDALDEMPDEELEDTLVTAADIRNILKRK